MGSNAEQSNAIEWDIRYNQRYGADDRPVQPEHLRNRSSSVVGCLEGKLDRTSGPVMNQALWSAKAIAAVNGVPVTGPVPNLENSLRAGKQADLGYRTSCEQVISRY